MRINSRIACLLSSIMIALAVIVLSPVAAQARTLGSPLTVAPNANFGCEIRPTFTSESYDGNYRYLPSGQPDCTWYQSGVIGNVEYADPRTGSVPADGFITSVSVRSGPNPAPLRIAILRQIGGIAGGGSPTSGCCGFVSETPPAGTPPLQPQPNSISTFPTCIRVERNVRGTSAVADYVGISAASNTGTLPLFSNGRNNLITDYTVGNTDAGFFYPRMGAFEAPGGGTRNNESIPGLEVLLQWNWEVSCTPGNPAAQPSPAAPPKPSPGVLALRNQVARVEAGKALIRMACNGSAPCEGQLALLAFGGARVSAKKVTPAYGKKSYKIAPQAKTIIKIKLNKRGKALLRKRKRAAVKLQIAPTGGTAVTNRLLLKR